MLNENIGTIRNLRGREYIETEIGKSGHAVFGPYEILDPGSYAVEFKLSALDGDSVEPNTPVAALDVCGEFGTLIIAKQHLTAGDLSKGDGRFLLPFTLSKRMQVEYRVGVSGNAALAVDETRRLHRLEDGVEIENLVQSDQFPNSEGAPRYFVENEPMFRELYKLGMGVRVEGDKIFLSKDGVVYNANSQDDVRFTNEIFFERAYNIALDRDVCVIDIGMNVGLASLQFASREHVKEIHAFEPFPSTYERACANLKLNPELSGKITAHNVGLGDRDGLETFTIRDSDDSGARATRNDSAGEIQIQLQMRAAGAALEPIIAAAERAGRVILAKIDCEGAEYAIFESLAASGLLERIHIFVVEWHPVIPGKSQLDLMEPLRERGFVVIDRSPLIGQGVFYAVRLPS